MVKLQAYTLKTEYILEKIHPYIIPVLRKIHNNESPDKYKYDPLTNSENKLIWLFLDFSEI